MAPQTDNEIKMAPQTNDEDLNSPDEAPVIVATADGTSNMDSAAAAAVEEEEEVKPPTCWQRIVAFYWANEFLILIVVAILLARAYPPLGAVYLAPQITATWIAVIFIFIMAGLGLKTEELSKAFQQFRFNIFVQLFNFGVVSSVVYGVSRLLVEFNALGQSLADGMVVCASLPLTINMVCVLTKSSGGDEASAIFNAAFGNMIGVFLSPVLILGYLGVTGGVDLFEVFYKLVLRVLVPVIVGQLLQKFSQTVVAFVKKYKPKFKAAQQYTLVFIVYTVFCRTFEEDSQAEVSDIFIMIAFQFVFLCFFMCVAWFLLGLFFHDSPELRVMGLFGCTHKTVAMGVPLINAIYENSPYVGQYTLPLLVWHPMQLVIGSFLVPRLLAFVKREHARLGITDDDDDDNDDNDNETKKPALSGDAKAPDEELAQAPPSIKEHKPSTEEDKANPPNPTATSTSIMTGELPTNS